MPKVNWDCISFALLRRVICPETRAVFSTNQMQDLNQLRLGPRVFPRFSSSCLLAIVLSLRHSSNVLCIMQYLCALISRWNVHGIYFKLSLKDGEFPTSIEPAIYKQRFSSTISDSQIFYQNAF